MVMAGEGRLRGSEASSAPVVMAVARGLAVLKVVEEEEAEVSVCSMGTGGWRCCWS